MRNASLLISVVLGAALACAAHAIAKTDGVRAAAAPAFRPAELARFSAENWPTVGGDYEQDRYSRLGQIDKHNVSRLRVAWHVHLDGSATGSKYRGEATPVVYSGVMYVVTGNDDVFALDATTGKRLWSRFSNIDQSISTICCGWDARGVAIGDGKVFVAQLDDTVVASRANTSSFPVTTYMTPL